MTQEQKELLLKDLCARWMSGLKCASNTKNSIVAYCTVDGIKRNIKGDLFIELTDRDIDGNAFASISTSKLDMVKPYLRPLSSITNEEKKGLFEAIGKDMDLLEETLDKEPLFRYGDNLYYGNPIHYELDFLISHHFDYLDLIPMGLALEATEGMYKI